MFAILVARQATLRKIISNSASRVGKSHARCTHCRRRRTRNRPKTENPAIPAATNAQKQYADVNTNNGNRCKRNHTPTGDYDSHNEKKGKTNPDQSLHIGEDRTVEKTEDLRKSTMTVRPVHMHGALRSALERFLDAENPISSKRDLLDGIQLCDFGVRYMVELIRPTKEKGSSRRAVLHVSVPGWEQLWEPAQANLLAIYGDSVSFAPQHSSFSFSFSIRIRDAILRFDSQADGLDHLSQLRTQVIGAPILRALERVSSKKGEGKIDEQVKQIQTLKTHPRFGTCHCLSSDEKTMIIFIVEVEDTTERALARLFLQQFEVAQKKVAQSPHCEFRRANEPTSEVEHLVTSGHIQNYENAIGFLSFSFFPFHVKTAEARWRATQLMVDFFPYLDKHIKSTKSYMHSRMRLMKDDLLRELGDSKTQQQNNGKNNRRFVVGDRMKWCDYRQISARPNEAVSSDNNRGVVVVVKAR